MRFKWDENLIQELQNGVFQLMAEDMEQPVFFRTLSSSVEDVDLPEGYTVWEDHWKFKTEIVISRIRSLMGDTKRIHGRSTTIESMTQAEAIAFMNENHLAGGAKAKYRYGLHWRGELVAAITFSKKKKLQRNGEVYASYELIRYCNLSGFTVVGGLSKLMKHFIRSEKPDDIMTYVDLDLSDGSAFELMRFECVETTEPLCFKWNEATNERLFPNRNERLKLAEETLLAEYPFKTSGNKKYVLWLKD